MKLYKGRLFCLLALATLSMLSKAAVAGSCTATTLDQYMVSGFSCTVGDLQLSNFNFYSNSLGSTAYSSINLPGSIVVTPQSSAGLDGLAFTNMGVYFSGNLSNTTSDVVFTVTALTGLITGDSVGMTNYAASGVDGEAQAQVFDGSSVLPVAIVNCKNCSSPPSLSNAQTFTGISTTSIYAAATALNTGFGGGSATVNGVTALFSTTVVPVPASLWLMLSGLGALGLLRRRKQQIIAA